ncbi:hypothetical protein PTT_10285 [Pyrenophora teres f. teres 0-1]|uniref:Uncharacterized protein n=1 Tax=Pyrenophora teres f. teres (strain 0-1) TaxID=861557 RepID=E3RNW6_PYRTT|nr:hypothetical protein PTT_10285 [Pyrenophora teres f. teres 0-1]
MGGGPGCSLPSGHSIGSVELAAAAGIHVYHPEGTWCAYTPHKLCTLRGGPYSPRSRDRGIGRRFFDANGRR